MTDRPPSPDEGNRSLQRGLRVLEYIWRNARDGVRVAQIMRACALERATVYRLLGTLLAAGYAARRGRYLYVPGPSIRGMLDDAPVHDLALRLDPLLRRISDISGDTAFAVVREGTQSRCIARRIGSFPIQVLAVEVGRRQPLGVGAAGLALLASLPRDEAAAIIASNAAALGGYGGMSPKRLAMLLEATRQRGWSVVGNHVATDTLAVGMAIAAADRDVLAAISVAAPLSRMGAERQLFLVRTMHEALAQLLPEGV